MACVLSKYSLLNSPSTFLVVGVEPFYAVPAVLTFCVRENNQGKGRKQKRNNNAFFSLTSTCVNLRNVSKEGKVARD